MNPCISIIIPVFNLGDVVIKCVDSIYKAHIPEDELEVICIDDASTDDITSKILNELSSLPKYPHLKIIKHELNKKMGGARNTGIRNASGKYLIFCDGDDYFDGDSLYNIYKHIKNQNDRLDVLMYDFKVHPNPSDEGHFIKNNTSAASGRNFFLSEQISWTVWLYACRKEYLTKNNLYFTENHFFEDVDWSIRLVILAKFIQYVPTIAYRHTLSENQTTKIGKSITKLQDYLLASERLYHLSDEFTTTDPEVAELIENHQIFHYNSFIVRYAWRIHFRRRYQLMVTYPPPPHRNFFLCKLAKSSPIFLSLLLSALAPLLHVASKIKNHKWQ